MRPDVGDSDGPKSSVVDEDREVGGLSDVERLTAGPECQSVVGASVCIDPLAESTRLTGDVADEGRVLAWSGAEQATGILNADRTYQRSL